MTELDRRTFIIGAAGIAGAGVFVAGCGDDADDGSTTQSSGDGEADSVDPTDPPSGDAGDGEAETPEPLAVPILVPSFPDGFRAPSPFVHSVDQRVAYALHDGVDVMRRNAPDEIQLEIFVGSEPIAGGFVTRRDQGVTTPYYSITFTPPAAGAYRSVLTQDGETSEHEFLVLEPGETTIPQPGDLLPAVATGTFADALGVNPLCTRIEPCPFHEIDLVDALAAPDKATVLSIATPGFCQTAICGPVIELLIEQAENRDDINVVHAEVFVDPNNDEGVSTGTADTTDIVDTYALPFEPVLFIADAEGTILRRLDAIYDGSELAEALALI